MYGMITELMIQLLDLRIYNNIENINSILMLNEYIFHFITSSPSSYNI